MEVAKQRLPAAKWLLPDLRTRPRPWGDVQPAPLMQLALPELLQALQVSGRLPRGSDGCGGGSKSACSSGCCGSSNSCGGVCSVSCAAAGDAAAADVAAVQLFRLCSAATFLGRLDVCSLWDGPQAELALRAAVQHPLLWREAVDLLRLLAAQSLRLAAVVVRVLAAALEQELAGGTAAANGDAVQGEGEEERQQMLLRVWIIVLGRLSCGAGRALVVPAAEQLLPALLHALAPQQRTPQGAVLPADRAHAQRLAGQALVPLGLALVPSAAAPLLRNSAAAQALMRAHARALVGALRDGAAVQAPATVLAAAWLLHSQLAAPGAGAMLCGRNDDDEGKGDAVLEPLPLLRDAVHALQLTPANAHDCKVALIQLCQQLLPLLPQQTSPAARGSECSSLLAAAAAVLGASPVQDPVNTCARIEMAAACRLVTAACSALPGSGGGEAAQCGAELLLRLEQLQRSLRAKKLSRSPSGEELLETAEAAAAALTAWLS